MQNAAQRSATESISSTPGNQIRRMREERGLRPVDIERVSESIRQRRGHPDFAINHATLNDIENQHSLPNVRRMFSLAVCFRVPLEQILSVYGASSEAARQFWSDVEPDATRIESLDSAFVAQFDKSFDLRRTGPFEMDITHWPSLPDTLQNRSDPANYCYAWVGMQDTTMADLIPPCSLVEVDRSQNIVEHSAWLTLRSRPIYFCWTKDGYRCAWCERHGDELVLLPHPVSDAQVKRYRGKEATVIGRIVHAWITFGETPALLKETGKS